MEQQYLDLLDYVSTHGVLRHNRTGTDTKSVFAPANISCDLNEGFPILTTKKVWWRGVVEELRWFISGSTNINDLHGTVQRWWAPWASADGSLGPTYGKQLRGATNGTNVVDQLHHVINLIKKDPDSRRMVISLWHTPDMQDTKLPCCHGTVIQFYVNDNKLSCHMYQRSADVFIGVPVNIASYALLTHLIADACGLGVGRYTHSFGDAHVYVNHMDQVAKQLARIVKDPPTLVIEQPPHWSTVQPIGKLERYTYDMLVLDGYDPQSSIQAPVAV